MDPRIVRIAFLIGLAGCLTSGSAWSQSTPFGTGGFDFFSQERLATVSSSSESPLRWSAGI